jgi:hypothetical protein
MNPTDTQLCMCQLCTKAKEGRRWFVVNICISRPHHQNTAVVMKVAQVSDMRPCHAICETLANSNKLYVNGIFAIFIQFMDLHSKNDIS